MTDQKNSTTGWDSKLPAPRHSTPDATDERATKPSRWEHPTHTAQADAADAHAHAIREDAKTWGRAGGGRDDLGSAGRASNASKPHGGNS